MKYTIPELLTCIIARELKNDDKIAIGLNAEMFLLAAFMAQKFYSQQLQIRHGLNYKTGELNPAAWTINTSSKEFSNFNYYEQHEEILNINNGFCNVFFISGIQIDKYGNTNLIGVKDKEGNMKLRGPGSIGTSAIAQQVKKYYIFTLEHSKRRLVEKCDYISTIGYTIRKKYGISGGPSLIITPLCVFDFVDGRIKLKSVHSHSSVEEVKEKTGFDFIHDNVIMTKEPTLEELKFIREFDREKSLQAIEKLIK